MNVQLCDRFEWLSLIGRSKYALPDHLWAERNIHLKFFKRGGGFIAFNFNRKVSLGLRLILSFGLRRSGGFFVDNLSNLNKINYVIRSFRSAFDLFNFTFKLHYNVNLASAIVKAINKYSNIYFSVLHARVLELKGGYNYIWRRKFNKKARNLARKFRKLGGAVRSVCNPIKLIDDIMECNLSNPFRQGRYLPQSYLDRALVIKGLKSRFYNERFHHFIGAFLDDKLVGYSYLSILNGYGYISRFLVHENYKGYGVSEGLMASIIKFLCDHGVEKVQYGYWDPKSAPGVDHFLKQHGFEDGPELAVFIPFTTKGFSMLRSRMFLDNVYHNVPFRDGFKKIMSTLFKNKYHIFLNSLLFRS